MRISDWSSDVCSSDLSYKKDLENLAAQTPANVKAVADKWLSRPTYALTIAPGARDAYQEATPTAKIPAKTAAKADADAAAVKGDRGSPPAVGKVAELVFPAILQARLANETGRTQGRARGCQAVSFPVVAIAL